MNTFVQGTRANDYLFFKDAGDGGRRASSQCRTPKYQQRFEREVPLAKRLEFLEEMSERVFRLSAFNNPQIDQAANEFFACCAEATQAAVPGLRATGALKAATANLDTAVGGLTIQC